MAHKVILRGMKWVCIDSEVCYHRRALRRAILRGQLQSLIWVHENFDTGVQAA